MNAQKTNFIQLEHTLRSRDYKVRNLEFEIRRTDEFKKRMEAQTTKQPFEYINKPYTVNIQQNKAELQRIKQKFQDIETKKINQSRLKSIELKRELQATQVQATNMFQKEYDRKKENRNLVYELDWQRNMRIQSAKMYKQNEQIKFSQGISQLKQERAEELKNTIKQKVQQEIELRFNLMVSKRAQSAKK
ncbi:Hypothetical_protein [Hexamita inflata]|uniref:Hypothetical_protein n=1 Tax=Hexamita inflata TaxID=28002 RepID=A0AA86NUD6_9EUKA|nr:Hypothetical protein HINF_LOCUS8147 [Hexamita inflata]CAI9925934.1 Hypothetical protein HINF_LOCUS13579 [Hexamita inflata]CAI9951397.1 Hypothetical protein HINF_LOCUS39042 [Hexamita inflata]